VKVFSDSNDADAAFAIMQGVMSTAATDLSIRDQVSVDIIGKLVVKCGTQRRTTWQVSQGSA
jgi:hypothetical protein